MRASILTRSVKGHKGVLYITNSISLELTGIYIASSRGKCQFRIMFFRYVKVKAKKKKKTQKSTPKKPKKTPKNSSIYIRIMINS